MRIAPCSRRYVLYNDHEYVFIWNLNICYVQSQQLIFNLKFSTSSMFNDAGSLRRNDAGGGCNRVSYTVNQTQFRFSPKVETFVDNLLNEFLNLFILLCGVRGLCIPYKSWSRESVLFLRTIVR